MQRGPGSGSGMNLTETQCNMNPVPSWRRTEEDFVPLDKFSGSLVVRCNNGARRKRACE